MPQSASRPAPDFQISFIVTFYDVPLPMLEQCLHSILDLPLQPEEREIILVDDASPLSPQPLLQALPNHVRYIRHEANQGTAVARNTGLDAARGTHIQFVDADDYLLHEGYAYCISLAHADRQLDIIALDHTRDAPRHHRPTHLPPLSGVQYMLTHNLRGADWVYLFRRDILGELRFTPGIVHEDEEFIPLLTLRAKRMTATTACAYFYRRRPSSIVTSQDPAHLQRRIRDAEQVIGNLQHFAQRLETTERAALMRRVHQLTMDHIYNVICLTKRNDETEAAVERLRAKGLFPIPRPNYTLKYACFRCISSTRCGRRLLLFLLRNRFNSSSLLKLNTP